MSTPAPIPCRICGCLDGEPGLCHAVVEPSRACYRVSGYDDWCSACGTWDKSLRKTFPAAPLEALACEHRAQRALQAGNKRGGLPGGYALRVHAARMRRKGLIMMAEAGLIDPAYKNPPPERDLPLCPPASA